MSHFVQIRNVPDETRRALKSRAAARGESLNAYLLGVLSREVERPTVAEVLERAGRRDENVDVSSVDILRSTRAAREQELAPRSSP